MVQNDAIVLLSGGLDSVVCLGLVKKISNRILALTFDYGQKSVEKEIKASKKISEFYKIEHKIVKLDWLKEISTSSLNQEKNILKLNMQNLEDQNLMKESAKALWVPNRNGLFINIAACFAEALCYNNIVIGANKEESKTFKDNSSEFIDAINNSLKNSVNSEIKVLAPLINMTKEEIVKTGIDINTPFEYIYSCYNNGEKNCSECESCLRLKRALELNHRYDIINKIF